MSMLKLPVLSNIGRSFKWELCQHCRICLRGPTTTWVPSFIYSCWPYIRIGIGLFWELCPRYIGIPVGNFTVQIWFRYQPPYQISESIQGTTLKITKIHATYNDYSCPPIDTGGITPGFAYNQEANISAHLVDPTKR